MKNFKIVMLVLALFSGATIPSHAQPARIATNLMKQLANSPGVKSAAGRLVQSLKNTPTPPSYPAVRPRITLMSQQVAPFPVWAGVKSAPQTTSARSLKNAKASPLSPATQRIVWSQPSTSGLMLPARLAQRAKPAAPAYSLSREDAKTGLQAVKTVARGYLKQQREEEEADRKRKNTAWPY